MTDPNEPHRRGSEVLDAIWEKVEARPSYTRDAEVLFRSKALDQLDVAAEVDNQLPLVSRRNWLLLVGVAFLVTSLLMWASLTPSVTSVNTTGLVVTPPGVTTVVTPVTGVVLDGETRAGAQITAGDAVAVVRAGDVDTPVVSLVSGVVWQVASVRGDAVEEGQTLVTVLPGGSDRSALFTVDAKQAAVIQEGMKVDVIAAGRTEGTVVDISASLPAETAGRRTGQILDPDLAWVVLTVELDSPLPAGTPASGVVVTSEETVLTRLVER